MNQFSKYIGLDVRKETIAVAVASKDDGEVRFASLGGLGNAVGAIAQDILHTWCIGAGVVQRATTVPVLEQATSVQKLGKKGQLTHRRGLTIIAPLDFENPSRGLHTMARINHSLVLLDALLVGPVLC